ncbi:hypothetical protein GMORB2_4906 [Geosmithia morbida]|uniref:SigF-like NTF2-like domain-containing protein n=1 Tax=Geosmithia morbida TaxID=1094350 RepID=A0A9P5CYH1_9HYPO|nr:uncharacterized protein GMORB2_4906 [Geosmithia morbida]KAF4119387.1 hypothetical protein GMORB2_4906 [Geosmithia morbida]
MENPALEIKDVIRILTTGSPPEQEASLKSYFTSDAAFYHPFCRVPSFPVGSVPFAPIRT